MNLFPIHFLHLDHSLSPQVTMKNVSLSSQFRKSFTFPYILTFPVNLLFSQFTFSPFSLVPHFETFCCKYSLTMFYLINSFSSSTFYTFTFPSLSLSSHFHFHFLPLLTFPFSPSHFSPISPHFPCHGLARITSSSHKLTSFHPLKNRRTGNLMMQWWWKV